MKLTPALLFVSLLVTVSCNKSGKGHHHESEPLKDNPNEALYNEVMSVHDEVMPKMEEIYRLKKELKEILNSNGEVADKKEQIKNTILLLDSADRGMMDWMHKFKPLPDSTDQETAREYLENEMEKINQVKELTRDAIERAKAELGKK